MPDARTQRILRQWLHTEALLGMQEVPVHAGGDVLPEVEEAPPVSQPIVRTVPSAGAAAVAPPVRPVAALDPRDTPAPQLVGNPNNPLFIPSPTAGSIPALPRPEKLRVLQAMDEDEVKGCKKCELCKARTNTVFGEGDPDAHLMFVGEGPGETEDETGRPFVGRAGELLDKMIIAMGLKREDVYIANVVKCRPPGNRPPQPQEADACAPYLLRQIKTIRPRVIVALGGPAYKRLAANARLGITAARGVWHKYEEVLPDLPAIPLMPTFHPSYVLRTYTPDTRGKVWSDLQKVMAHLKEMPA